jgi:hypothetical protein
MDVSYGLFSPKNMVKGPGIPAFSSAIFKSSEFKNF